MVTVATAPEYECAGVEERCRGHAVRKDEKNYS